MKNIQLIILGLMWMTTAGAQQVEYKWKMYEFSVVVDAEMVVINNDAESLIIAGDGIEIGIYDFVDRRSQGQSLEEFAIFLRRLFRLEDPDPIYPMDTGHLKGFVAGGYKDFSRIVIFTFDTDQGRFFSTATFDEDDLDAEEEALKVLKQIRAE